VTYAGKTWRIDGAPTDADILGVSCATSGPNAAGDRGAQSGDRYKRFAAKVMARTRAPEGTLYADLKTFSGTSPLVESSRSTEPWAARP
jgi:hypothetical protein